jgi:hypothetical protein
MASLNPSLLLLLLSVEQEHFCLWLLADGTEVTQIRRQQKNLVFFPVIDTCQILHKGCVHCVSDLVGLKNASHTKSCSLVKLQMIKLIVEVYVLYIFSFACIYKAGFPIISIISRTNGN